MSESLPSGEKDAPYGWFDPEWVRVESTVFGDDGTITRSSVWVRSEDWFRNDVTPLAPTRTEGDA